MIEWELWKSIALCEGAGNAKRGYRMIDKIDLNDPAVTLIPSLSTGDPFTIGETSNSTGPVAIYLNAQANPTSGLITADVGGSYVAANMTVDSFSQIARINSTAIRTQ